MITATTNDSDASSANATDVTLGTDTGVLSGTPDTISTDNDAKVVSVSFDSNGDGTIGVGEVFAVTDGVVTDIVTPFGTLHMDAEGDYLYEGSLDASNQLALLDDGSITVFDQGFFYTIEDGDLDTSSALLTIRIQAEGPAYDYTGDDVYLGSVFDDTFAADGGNDILEGQEGADTLSGGTGTDTFVYKTGDGGDTLSEADLITDFENGTDILDVSGTTATVIGDVTVGDDGSGNATISIGGEFLAILNNVAPGDIDATDFTFV